MMIQTARLMMRELQESDYDDLCKILKDPITMYAYEHGFSDEEVREWLDKQMKRYKEDGFGLWAVILKESNAFVGQCGITMQDIGKKQVLEVGYLFNRDFWHKGYAAEAAIACRDYAFKTLNAEEVYSIIRENNTSSVSVARYNGMENSGRIIKYYHGMEMPHDLYRITKTEWGKQNQIDDYSYQLGVIDCFNEMVHAGLKRIALSHPVRTAGERNQYLGFCNRICAKYGTFWYPENGGFVTDLFPERLNKDTYNIVFYRLPEDIDNYLELKKRKHNLENAGLYEGEARREIAREFGRLLSYSEEAIERMLFTTIVRVVEE